MSFLIVGLSGVTNGGKTTLSKNLLKALPSGTKLIKEDEYFYSENNPNHIPSPGGINHHNWEVISALNIDAMVSDINTIIGQKNDKEVYLDKENLHLCKKIMSMQHGEPYSFGQIQSILENCKGHKQIMLLDGFNMYDDTRIRQLCHLKFFFTLPKEVCFERRQIRVYDPPDPSGYFEACVWPMYQEHLQRVKQYEDIQFFDGALNMDYIFLTVLQKIINASVICKH